MRFICLFALYAVFFISLKSNKSVCNIVSIFSGFWSVIVTFSLFNLYGIYKSSDLTYIYITLGVVFFSLGSLVGKKTSISFVNKTKTVYFNTDSINKTLFYILIVICLICNIPNFQRILYFIRTGFNINSMYNSIAIEDEIISGFGSRWQNVIQIYIGYPILYLIISTSILMFLTTGEKKYFFIMAAFTMLRFLADIKRTVIVMVAFLFVFYFILLKNKNDQEHIIGIRRPKWLKKKYLIIFFLVFIIVYVAISKLRTGESKNNYSIAKNLYLYYVGSIKYFDLRVQNFSSLNIGHTCGFFSLRGLLSPFASFLEKIIGIEIPLYSNATTAVYSLHNISYSIAPDQRYNSYATAFYVFYVDFGVLGILLGSFLFGFFGGKLYRQYINNGDLLSVQRLGFFISIYILFSMLSFMPVTNYLIWSLLLTPLIYSRKQCKD